MEGKRDGYKEGFIPGVEGEEVTVDCFVLLFFGCYMLLVASSRKRVLK